MRRLLAALLLLVVPAMALPSMAGAGPGGHGGPVRAAALDTPGARLLTGGFDNRLVLWDAGEGHELASIVAHDAAVAFVALSRGGDLAISAGDDGSLALWRLPELTPAGRIATGAKPSALAVDPTGERVALARFDGGVELRRLADGSLIAPAAATAPRTTALLFPDGGSLLAGTADGFLELRRLDGATAPPLRVRAHDFAITDLALLPGLKLASGSVDGTVRLWRLPGLEPAGELSGHERPVLALAAEPGGGLLASGDSEGRIILWRLADRTSLHVLAAHEGAVFDLAFGPAQRLWSVGGDGAVRGWQGPGFEAVAGGGGPVDIEPPALPGHARGRELFRTCIACHSLAADGGGRAGPSLHRLYGRLAGSLPGYRYSPALQASGIVWTEETLARLFELGPDRYTPGSKMPLQRMPDEADRAALAAYVAAVTGGDDVSRKERAP
ncbi:c-type cytochrome [Geminicoccaceae bacterium 1502E]|nr:c-type cytochrome [Geminicoccaceae bacterium 1502E]